MTKAQRELARHALGLPNMVNRSFRNRYAVNRRSEAERMWKALLAAGCALIAWHGVHMVGYKLTEKGAREALEPGESLCPEDFPMSEEV